MGYDRIPLYPILYPILSYPILRDAAGIVGGAARARVAEEEWLAPEGFPFLRVLMPDHGLWIIDTISADRSYDLGGFYI